MSDPLDEQLREAVRRQLDHAAASRRTDRTTGWTRQQWIDDADRLFNDPDGSVLDLVNGHVGAMLDEIHILRAELSAATTSDPGRSGCAATAQAVSILACHLYPDRHHRCSLDHHPGDHRCLCGVVFLPKGKDADRDGLAETIHHEDGPQPPRGGSGGSRSTDGSA